MKPLISAFTSVCLSGQRPVVWPSLLTTSSSPCCGIPADGLGGRGGAASAAADIRTAKSSVRTTLVVRCITSLLDAAKRALQGGSTSSVKGRTGEEEELAKSFFTTEARRTRREGRLCDCVKDEVTK